MEVRIAAILQALISRLGLGKDYCIEISRQAIADLTGVTLETASRVCKTLERNGILDLSQYGVVKICDIEQLTKIAAL